VRPIAWHFAARHLGRAALGILLLAAVPLSAHAQGAGEPTVSGSSVGYIDSALPADLFRLRFDAAYQDRRPTRAEFFWAKGGPAGPGTPLPETRVDYQDISSYLELRITSCLSGFVECPVRFLNPEVNRNTAGLADMNAGLKLAFWQTADTVATFQFRTYVPTGEARRGLGTDHVSLEPALLLYQRLAPHWTLEGEFRTWVPVGGTDFAGDLVRYGIGVSYGTRQPDTFWVTPVVEFVGWTVLNGKESVVGPSGLGGVKGTSGQTIMNVKLGARFGFSDWADVYAGYGRALTGDTWYKDTWRIELRLLF
jgi:hypothetical protein